MAFVNKAKKVLHRALETAKNGVTLGGYSALNESVANYENKLAEHKTSELQFEAANSQFKASVEILGNETAECIRLVKEMQGFVQRLSYSERTLDLPNVPSFNAPDLSEVNHVLSEFNTAVAAGKGAGLGLAASTGTWILVAHAGAASTGTAISGLAGAAAHSAILAWFGGGALAAGGGGMALGSITIGAIAAIPLFAYSTYKSYKEAARIDRERERVEASLSENERNKDKILIAKKSADSLQLEIQQKRAECGNRFADLRVEAQGIANKAALEANSFAEYLLAAARAKGATA